MRDSGARALVADLQLVPDAHGAQHSWVGVGAEGAGALGAMG